VNRMNLGWEALAAYFAFLGAVVSIVAGFWALGSGSPSWPVGLWFCLGLVVLVGSVLLFGPLSARTKRIAATREAAALASWVDDARYSLPLGPGVPVKQGTLRQTMMLRAMAPVGMYFVTTVLTIGAVAKYLDDHLLESPLLALVVLWMMAISLPVLLVRFRPVLLIEVSSDALELASGRRRSSLRFNDIAWWRLDGGPDGPVVTASRGAGRFGPAVQILVSDDRILDLFVAKVGLERRLRSHLTMASS
jgi:hypothetical protein